MPQVIWFSRHASTPAQQEEMKRICPESEGELWLSSAANVNLQTDKDVEKVWKEIRYAVKDNQVDWLNRAYVFGVFPAPIQELISDGLLDSSFYASWNIQRSVEGKPPTFEHKKFCLVG